MLHTGEFFGTPKGHFVSKAYTAFVERIRQTKNKKQLERGGKASTNFKAYYHLIRVTLVLR
ncbi:hypothetical protein CHH52_07120 [Shouchella clausii]|nr:hypothetical protein CHH52_07120 [Shouchella clausii]